MRGRAIPLSRPRRMVIDLLHFAKRVPSIPVQRRMSLGPVVNARAACHLRPRWAAIFTKGFAIVAQEFPQLRRAYIKLPWPMLYEYPTSNANIIVEREYYGEPALFSTLIKDPATRSLSDVGRVLENAIKAPIDSIKEFRRAIRIAALPRPLRRLLWWLGLNIGRQRSNFFGTFAISIYSALNSESLHPLTPLTTVLNYGVIGREGDVNVRIVYDHRVLDGATVARALARLEEILNTQIVDELKSLAKDERLREKV
jgi:hypothetical protein